MKIKVEMGNEEYELAYLNAYTPISRENENSNLDSSFYFIDIFCYA